MKYIPYIVLVQCSLWDKMCRNMTMTCIGETAHTIKERFLKIWQELKEEKSSSVLYLDAKSGHGGSRDDIELKILPTMNRLNTQITEAICIIDID